MRPSNYIWRLFSNDYIILQAVRILQNIITLVHNVSSLSFIAFTHIHHHIRRNRQNCFRLLRHDVIYVPDPRPRPTGSARPFVLCNHHHVAGGSIVGLCIVWWPVRCSWICWAAASVATLLLSPEVSLSRSSAGVRDAAGGVDQEEGDDRLHRYRPSWHSSPHPAIRTKPNCKRQHWHSSPPPSSLPLLPSGSLASLTEGDKLPWMSYVVVDLSDQLGLQVRRVEANANERNRIRQFNAAMTRLRQVFNLHIGITITIIIIAIIISII